MIDEGTKLSLYDSLVPKLREHRRFKLLANAEFSLADFKIQQKVRSLEYELEKKKLPTLIEHNEMMKAKIEQLNEELDIVKWYSRIMEKGVNTRELVKEHYELKEMYEELKTTSKKRIETLDK